MPAFEVGVDPGGQREDLFAATREGGGAERGRDEVADEARVEGVAGEGEAGGGEHFPALGCGCRADVEEREVAGAAAEVADEDGFGAGEGGLVGGGRGQGFELEGDVLEAGAGEGGAQAGEREGLVFGGFSADEAHGTAYGGGADGVSPGLLGLQAEVGEDAGDEVFEGVGAAEDLGGGEALDGQVAFERLDEAAGGQAFGLGGEVALDGGRAGGGADRVGGAFEEEDGSRAWRLVGEAQEIDLAVAVAGEDGARDGTVGRAEVDADGGVFCGHGRPPVGVLVA